MIRISALRRDGELTIDPDEGSQLEISITSVLADGIGVSEAVMSILAAFCTEMRTAWDPQKWSIHSLTCFRVSILILDRHDEKFSALEPVPKAADANSEHRRREKSQRSARPS